MIKIDLIQIQGLCVVYIYLA